MLVAHWRCRIGGMEAAVVWAVGTGIAKGCYFRLEELWIEEGLKSPLARLRYYVILQLRYVCREKKSQVFREMGNRYLASG